MILLSKLADYGVILMVRLAMQGDRQINAAALAEETHLGEPTIAKVLKTLVHAGLVSSVRGPAGGYRLSRLPSAISVSEIVTAIDGKFGVTACAASEESCDRSAFCVTRPHWNRINDAIDQALAAVTLADMTPRADFGRFDLPQREAESLTS